MANEEEKYKDTDKPVDRHKPFWVVWCPTVNVPGKFETDHGAQTHAMKLVDKHGRNHQPFYVGKMTLEYTSVPAIKHLGEG